MNKLLPILLVVGLAIIPELSFTYDRDSYEGFSSRTGGSGGASFIGIIIFIIFLVAYIMNPKEYEGFTVILQFMAIALIIYLVRLAV